jgi:NAD(P)-dependent dehydrogenase (short-subunit alcohol dehydrogenase family)
VSSPRAHRWTTDDVPPQFQRTVVITGATSGLGLAATRALAGAGANVVLAARDEAKATHVIEDIRKANPGLELEFQAIDTARLSSVFDFADRWKKSGRSIDILLLDAGISNVPRREVTLDGFERQLATNYLGHFALAGLLLPFVTQSIGSRIVTVSSLQHRRAELHLDDLQLTKSYSPMRAYGQSKLATLMLALELDKRLQTAGSAVAAIAAHPGVAATQIVSAGGEASQFGQNLAKRLFGLVGQSSEQGALPLLFAATADEARRGGYYGPDGWGERRGYPAPAHIAPLALDRHERTQLWELSEELTGVTYSF